MNSILPEYRVEELPSRFVGYPDGTEIYVQPHSFGSAMNIEMVGRNNIKIMDETLYGVKVKGMSKNLLTPQDILFLGVYRNLVSSKSNKINIKSICPKCLKENIVSKSLNIIQFKAIEDFNKDVYPLEVDFNEYTFWFGFVSYKDFEFCVNRYKGHKLYQLCLQVQKYQNKETGELFEKPEYNARTGKTRDIALIEKYINEVRDILFNLVDEDKDTLEEVTSLLEDYGVKPIDIVCSDENCKHEYKIDLDDENVLVMPFRESKATPRSRIRLCKSNVHRSDNFETDEFEGSTSIDGNDKEIEKQPIEVEQTLHHKSKSEQITYFKDTTNENT